MNPATDLRVSEPLYPGEQAHTCREAVDSGQSEWSQSGFLWMAVVVETCKWLTVPKKTQTVKHSSEATPGNKVAG